MGIYKFAALGLAGAVGITMLHPEAVGPALVILYNLLSRWQGGGVSQDNWALALGNFRPLDQEHGLIRNVTTQAYGQIPTALYGSTYLRVGPNSLFPHKERQYHFFDGQGMVSAVHFNHDGSVNVANRFVRNARYAEAKEAGDLVHLRIGDMRGFVGLLKIMISAVREKLGIVSDILQAGTHNTALLQHGDTELFALVESSLPLRMMVTKEGDLVFNATEDFNGQWHYPFSAHSKSDPTTGEVILFGYSRNKPHAQVGVRRNGAVQVTPISLPRPVMIHDLAITNKFVLVMDLPLVMDPANMVKNGALIFDMKPELPARVGLVPRDDLRDEAVQWFSVKAGFVFHTAFAFDRDNGETVLVACRYDETFELDFESGVGGALLYRWVFDRNTGETKAEEVLLQGVTVEFPIINPACLTGDVPPQYVYCIKTLSETEGVGLQGIVKVALDENNGGSGAARIVGRLDLGEDISGGETSFVSTGPGEDEGFLVGFVHNETSGVSAALVVDAATMLRVSETTLPVRIPSGFHGTYLDSGFKRDGS